MEGIEETRKWKLIRTFFFLFQIEGDTVAFGFFGKRWIRVFKNQCGLQTDFEPNELTCSLGLVQYTEVQTITSLGGKSPIVLNLFKLD